MKTFDEWWDNEMKNNGHILKPTESAWNASREATIDEVIEILGNEQGDDFVYSVTINKVKALRGKQ